MLHVTLRARLNTGLVNEPGSVLIARMGFVRGEMIFIDFLSSNDCH